MKAITVILLFILASGFRLFPFKWGSYLTAYDPYFQYRATEYIVKNGFQAWFTWRDQMSWYPYGRDVAKTAYLGVPFTGAIFYILLQSLGIKCSLMEACSFLPALLGALSAILAYLIGREVDGEVTGIFAGLLLATSPAFISRTTAGFYDTESVGFFAMMLSLYFWIKAMKMNSIIMAILSGLALAYMNASWGGGLYLLNLYTIYVVFMLIIGKYSRKLLTIYSTTIGTALLLLSQVPIFVRKYLIGYATIPSIALIAIASIISIIKDTKKRESMILGLIFIILMIASGITILQFKGYLRTLTGRILTVIVPSIRENIPLVASVAEHKTPTWGYMFFQYSATAILAPLGIYFALKRRKDYDILLSIAGITSIYFASSMMRLIMLAAPFISILAGVGISRLLKTHIETIIRKRITAKRGRKIAVGTSRAGSVGVLIMLFLILAVTLTSWRTVAYSPQTIITCGGVPGGTKYKDWIEALLWMRVNLPEDAVVASWWDYGYWITTLGNKTSICDNATLNATQIKSVALAFMSNETTALKIFKKLGVTHVLVFETFDPQTGFLLHGRGYGDFAKSYWMIRIAGLNVSDYIKVYREKGIQTPEGPKAANSTLYRMLFATRREIWKSWGIDIPAPEHFKLVFKSTNGFVFIYEVVYGEEAEG
ncbi:MAG: hypothetical protein DRJ21_00100 [Candidatus Methanomethylicota archaeon]|uniref:dolichyl-phosphooligosaccharide-protein glycotransferase n=1 Tax=Thermoproteota archaeon TaxID=2056631 RepID=A0A497EVM5_9CREN|nr:MAG: hypothetical protein DRJ21_00100 [Candidatus Verstraetearchaeota archaeon]